MIKRKRMKTNKCLYCNAEGTNITVDTADEMIFLCDRHLKMFRSKYPKERYKKKKDDDE